MYTHASRDYECPFCAIVRGEEREGWSNKEDIFYEDDLVMAWVSLMKWPNNPGNVIVVPKEHFENVYDLPDTFLSAVYAAAKKVAVAMKELYGCEGVSMRQHNEPAGNQDVWHYHVQVLPRWEGDDLYALFEERSTASKEERKRFAKRLREYFKGLF